MALQRDNTLAQLWADYPKGGKATYCDICNRSNLEVQAHCAIEFCVQISCRSCDDNRFWYVCRVCLEGGEARKANKLKNIDGFKAHWRRYHDDKRGEKRPRENIVAIDDYIALQVQDEESDFKKKILSCEYFDRDASRLYFSEFGNDELAAPRAMVSRSLSSGISSSMDLPEHHTMYHVEMCKHSFTLSKPQLVGLGKVLTLASLCNQPYMVHEVIRKEEDKKCMRLDLTYDLAKFRKIYLSSDTGMVNQLPHPGISLINEHAYVSLKAILADQLAHGIHKKKDVLFTHTQESKAIIERAKTGPRGREIKDIKDSMGFANSLEQIEQTIKESVAVFPMTDWSDVVEANNLKQGRSQIHVKTVTINRPKNAEYCSDYTYPISLSAKAQDHGKMEEAFSEELKDFMNPELPHMFWSKSHGRFIRAVVVLNASIQDQPERREVCALISGNSRIHPRFGYAYDYFANWKVLPSCNECQNNIYEALEKLDCENCACWHVRDKHSVDPPDGFPKDAPELIGGNKVPPMQLTFPKMSGAVDYGRNRMEDKDDKNPWSKKQASAYLQYYCLAKELREALLEASELRVQVRKKIKILNAKLGDGTQTEEDLAEILYLEDKLQDIVDMPYPAMWKQGYCLSLHIDAPMHLLFLGLVKSTIMAVLDWLKLMRIHSEFMKFAANILGQFPQMDWLKLQEFTGAKLGHWVSENFLAFARVMKWLFSAIKFMKQSAPYVEPTEQDYSKWTADQCKDWLGANSITLEFLKNSADKFSDIFNDALQKILSTPEKGKGIGRLRIAEKRTVIRYFKLHPDELPPKVDTVLCDSDHVLRTIDSLYEMIAALMQESMVEGFEVYIRVRIVDFLNCYAVLDECIGRAEEGKKKADRKPGWITSYNFLSLLNLPDTIKMLGPIRNYWEGGQMGEAYAQEVKKAVKTGLRKNWPVPLMKRILRKKSLALISRPIDSIDPTKYDNDQFDDDDVPSLEEEEEEEEEEGDLDEDEQVELAMKKMRGLPPFKRYANLEAVLHLFNSRLPIAVGVNAEGSLYVLLANEKVVPLVKEESNHRISDSGVEYYMYKMEQKEEYFAKNNKPIKYGVIMPKLTSEGFPRSDTPAVYALVTNDWPMTKWEIPGAIPENETTTTSAAVATA